MHGMHDDVLRLEGVSYAVRERTLIHDLTFAPRHGRRTLLIGPNGAGKSLTLRLCHGLIAPTAGRVTARGGPRRRALVFQRPVLLRRSAAANLVHAGALAGLGYRERRARAAAALERFGLGAFANRAARSLSGGEQQRLAIARAWVAAPELLLLDEPTAALDPAATRAVEQMIAACHQDGMTILMTTHDLGQARRLADDVLFMHAGRLVEQRPASEFFDAPRRPETQAFLRGDLLW